MVPPRETRRTLKKSHPRSVRWPIGCPHRRHLSTQGSVTRPPPPQTQRMKIALGNQLQHGRIGNGEASRMVTREHEELQLPGSSSLKSWFPRDEVLGGCDEVEDHTISPVTGDNRPNGSGNTRQQCRGDGHQSGQNRPSPSTRATCGLRQRLQKRLGSGCWVVRFHLVPICLGSSVG